MPGLKPTCMSAAIPDAQVAERDAAAAAAAEGCRLTSADSVRTGGEPAPGRRSGGTASPTATGAPSISTGDPDDDPQRDADVTRTKRFDDRYTATLNTDVNTPVEIFPQFGQAMNGMPVAGMQPSTTQASITWTIQVTGMAYSITTTTPLAPN